MLAASTAREPTRAADPVTPDPVVRWVPVPEPGRVPPLTGDAGAPTPHQPIIDQIVVPRIPRFVVVEPTAPTPITASDILRAPSSILPSGGAQLPGGSVHSAGVVDRQVAPDPRNGRPRYPDAMRAASVAGEVVARFVVDTTGVVEPSSITILVATHALFGDAVRRWLPQTRYTPAEYAGRRVRQLVEQRMEFTLAR
jgi:TonB family protein